MCVRVCVRVRVCARVRVRVHMRVHVRLGACAHVRVREGYSASISVHVCMYYQVPCSGVLVRTAISAYRQALHENACRRAHTRESGMFVAAVN